VYLKGFYHHANLPIPTRYRSVRPTAPKLPSRYGLIQEHSPEQPINSRGWTLQEYLLSPRVLMFGADELTWHCQTEQFVPVRKSHLEYSHPPVRLPRNKVNGDWNSRRDEQLEIWNEIIYDFSARSFSFVTDKPNAILGIAQELETIWNDYYI
jgi:hypothetical protein